jgi:hypothetical protein
MARLNDNDDHTDEQIDEQSTIGGAGRDRSWLKFVSKVYRRPPNDRPRLL